MSSTVMDLVLNQELMHEDSAFACMQTEPVNALVFKWDDVIVPPEDVEDI
jgi:hypothetical protein